MDHTVHGLAIAQVLTISNVLIEGITTQHITYKWGFDGSSNHSIYKQNLHDSCDSIDFAIEHFSWTQQFKRDCMDEITLDFVYSSNFSSLKRPLSWNKKPSILNNEL